MRFLRPDPSLCPPSLTVGARSVRSFRPCRFSSQDLHKTYCTGYQLQDRVPDLTWFIPQSPLPDTPAHGGRRIPPGTGPPCTNRVPFLGSDLRELPVSSVGQECRGFRGPTTVSRPQTLWFCARTVDLRGSGRRDSQQGNGSFTKRQVRGSGRGATPLHWSTTVVRVMSVHL